MPRREAPWTFRVGRRGARVTVYEKVPGGMLYARTWDPHAQRFVKRSLKHGDRDKAEAWAVEEVRRLKEGRAELAAGTVTLGRILDCYLVQHTPTKGTTEQGHDARRAVLFRAVFGAERDPLTLDEPHVWEAYVAARRSGAITARGEPVPAKDRRPLTRDRVLEQETSWCVWVLAWATRRKEGGRYLLARAPTLKQLRQSVAGWPRVEHVRRPVASADRFAKVRAVAERVTQERRTEGRRVPVPSYLPELLDLAFHTGRRLSQILQLTHGDYLPDAVNPATGQPLPFGAIRWPAAHDKQGREWTAPLNREAQVAVLRIRRTRPGMGPALLFPSLRDPSRPITRHLADDWLRRAEHLAGLASQDGSAWHAYRRGWATARKGLPAVDVAAAGGWAGPHTLETVYQQADMDTMLTVVTSPAEVRERHA